MITGFAIFRLRWYLTSLPLVAALFIISGRVQNDIIIWPVGITVFLAGFMCRLWAQQHLHYRMDISKQMTTSGPYGLMRNPIYIGNGLMCIGSTVLSEVLWMVPVTIFWCVLVYNLVVRYEEKHLLGKYGEVFAKYLQDVPRWVPRRMGFSNLELVNKYFPKVLLAEAHCLLMVVPFVVKKSAPWWVGI